MKIIFSFADKEATLVFPLKEDIKERLRLEFPEVEHWDFHDIHAGDNPDERIIAEFKSADIGFLFVSPSSLTAKMIIETEIPLLLENETLVPVGVRRVDWPIVERHFPKRQVYLYKVPGHGRHERTRKWYFDCNEQEREYFVEEMIPQIREFVMKGQIRDFVKKAGSK